MKQAQMYELRAILSTMGLWPDPDHRPAIEVWTRLLAQRKEAQQRHKAKAKLQHETR
jgi:hypothetical protein